MGAVSVSSSSEGLAPHGASRGGRCEDVSGGPDNEDSTTSEARRQGGVGTRGRLCELRLELAHTTASELANGPQMMAPRKSSGRRSQRFVMDLR